MTVTNNDRIFGAAAAQVFKTSVLVFRDRDAYVSGVRRPANRENEHGKDADKGIEIRQRIKTKSTQKNVDSKHRNMPTYRDQTTPDGTGPVIKARPGPARPGPAR